MTYEEMQSLYEQAKTDEAQGRYDEAERHLQQILFELPNAEFSSINDADVLRGKLKSQALWMLGVVSYRRSDYFKALEYLQASLALSEEQNDKDGVARAVGVIANVHTSRSDYSTALEHYHRALGLAEELNDKSKIASNLGNIAVVYNRQSSFPKALEYFERALRLDQEIGSASGVARHLGNIGTVYDGLSEYPKALEYYLQSLSYAEDLGNKLLIATALTNIANAYTQLSDYVKAIEYHNKALCIVEEIGAKEGVATCLGGIGNVYSRLADYTRALESFVRALGIEEELENPIGQAIQFCNIGNIYNDLEDFSKGLEYYSKALRIAEASGNPRKEALFLGNIGISYSNLSDHARAHEYYVKALSIVEEIGDKEGVAQWIGMIATTLQQLHDYPKALEYFERCLILLEELGDKYHSMGLGVAMGEFYATEQNPFYDLSKAETHLLASAAMSEELGTKHFQIYKVLSDIYARQERWKESREHFEKFYSLGKEVQSEEAKKSVLLMEQRTQMAEREKEVAVAKAASDAQLSATNGLLHKVLPESIATRLVNGEKVADYFDRVSILFADIVGFTPISSRMPAKAVLAFLNYVFGEFDKMVLATGCEKIKTIGDGYLAVAGAPESCNDHAERIARLAIEMSKDIILPDEIRNTLPKGAQFSLRIGIHTGPCFGGIVGENRFVYDIYSDAVNIAARMESHGEAGKIHVSDEFCFHLQNRMDSTGDDLGGIRFDEREEMEIKGKGLIRTYFLEKV